MRIGIDMLGNQSSSRNRGIGRYTRQLVGQFLSRHPRHEYVLYRYDGLPGVDDEWPGKPELRLISCEAPDGGLRECAERIANENPDRLDLLLQTTPLECFHGHLPPAKTLHGPKLAAVLYDLIPMLFQELYLADSRYSQLYFQAVRQLRQYDLLLAISEASRLDAQRVLAAPGERVVSIGAASNSEVFFPDRTQPMPAPARETLEKLGVTGPFIYCLSGLDGRKNLHGLLQAYALLRPEIKARHQLAITCYMNAEEETHWRAEARRLEIESRLVLTNFLPDETVRVLYQRCAAFVFPSFYEGFGLPLLEAMLCGAPIVAGRNSSQHEVVGEAGLLAEVGAPAEIAAQLGRLLDDPELAAALRERGPRQAQKFSWESTADKAIAAMERLVEGQAPPTRRPKPRGSRPKDRIAFFSPLPPKRSGIADYSQSLLAELSKHYVIDLFHAPAYVPHLSMASLDFACHDYRLFPRYQRALNYRGLVYQMGNSKYHGFVYDTLLTYPGVVVMHELALTGFHHWYALQPGVAADHFARQLAGDNPALAAEYAAERERWAAQPGGIIAACNRRGACMNQEILDRAAGVIVHDARGAERIRQPRPELADYVSVVPHGAEIAELSLAERRAIRRQFGIPEAALLFGSFGILHATKCNAETIEAFAPIARSYPSAVLMFVGRDLAEGEAQRKADAMGLGDRVRFFGHTPLAAFRELAAVTDIGINLRRPPTNGETSGALLTLLSAGVPTVVIDVDTFGSYPDDVVRKTPWSSELVGELTQIFRQFANEPERRTRLGENALRHVRANHSWAKSAALYAEVIEHTYLRQQLDRRLAG